MKKENRKFASEDILAIEELAEQLASELDVDDDIEQVEDETADAVPIVEDQTPDEVIAAAEELLADAELPDEKKIIGDCLYIGAFTIKSITICRMKTGVLFQT